jgi:RNA polymerase sigma factor (sigma-70 family)
MRAPAQAPKGPLRPDQVKDLLDLIGWVCAKRGLAGLPQGFRERLEALGDPAPHAISSDRDRKEWAALQAGLRQLARSLPAAYVPLDPSRERIENDILLDVILRHWILERYPGWSVAWWLLLFWRHQKDISRGLWPFRDALIEKGLLGPRDSPSDLVADFLGPLVEHLSENNHARLRRWDPLKGPMGPWLRQVVWQLGWDELRSRPPELPLEEDEEAEGLPSEERIEDAPLRQELEEIERRLAVQRILEMLRKGLEPTDWLILWAAYIEGWRDEEIAELLEVRRETVNRCKRRALRKALCALWQGTVREGELLDSRIARVVSGYCVGSSPEEIARSLGLSVDEVNACLQEAIRILKSQLGF